MGERIIHSDSVAICTEAFGRSNDPPLLLIMGATASMVWWPDSFCEALAAAGRYVIRCDNRDTGRSVTYPPGQPGYSLDDMADDAVAVLAAYGIGKAHLVGMPLGGMLAQIVALKYPELVVSQTLISSSVFGPEDPALPGIDAKILEYHQSGGAVDWSNQQAVIDFMVKGGASSAAALIHLSTLPSKRLPHGKCGALRICQACSITPYSRAGSSGVVGRRRFANRLL
jgi:pimeloyl-ACP methyl ester carboxylesterase